MNRPAVHEAGHVVAHLARGYVPRYVVIEADGRSGRTGLSEEFGDDELSRAISAVAGVVAEREIIGRDFGMSRGDVDNLQDAADASGREYAELAAWATAEATSIVQTHRDAVLAVAAALERELKLPALALCRLCESPGPLNRFAGLFQRKRSA